jgi:hypothetical protein
LELQALRSQDAAFPSLWYQFMYQTIRVLPSTLYTSQNGSIAGPIFDLKQLFEEGPARVITW